MFKVGDNDNRMSLLLLVFFRLCAVETFAISKNCQQTNTCSKVHKNHIKLVYSIDIMLLSLLSAMNTLIKTPRRLI